MRKIELTDEDTLELEEKRTREKWKRGLRLALCHRQKILEEGRPKIQMPHTNGFLK